MSTPAGKTNNSRFLLVLAGVALAMLCLGLFGMRPLYGLWCRMTGTQAGSNQVGHQTDIATGRRLRIFFETTVFDELPVRFWCSEPDQRLEVGAEGQTEFHIENLSDRTLHIRPMHQVSPVDAAQDLSKRICFCFINQVLAPHEKKIFPVLYRFAPKLSPRTTVVTLRYGIFAVDAAKADDPDEILRQESRMGGNVVRPKTYVLPSKAKP